MGFIIINLIKKLIILFIKLSLFSVVFAAVIVLIPNLPPYTKFTSIELEPLQPRVGPLAHNELLNNAEKRYKGKLLGPEAFQVLNGELYTSLATGEIVKVSPGGHITFVTKIGQPCSGLSKEYICGRPLGFQIDESSKTMYVVDAYYGIWKVDLKTDKKQLLVSPRVKIEKRQPKLFNSIALLKNGDFYWTDSSSEFQLKDGAITAFTDPAGRLLHYNAAKNESKVLADELWFPNGLALSPGGEFLIVSETFRYKLLKHYIAGPKKGTTEDFIAGLPGTPDNVRALPDGSGLLVGLYVVFDEQNPLLSRSMAATPSLRKFLARLTRLVEIPFEYFNTLYPHHLFEEAVYYIGHFKTVSPLAPKLTGLLHLDWNGNVVAAYYNTDGSLGHVSDAIVFGDKLYTGSPHGQDYIAAIPAPPQLKNAFTTKKVDNIAKEAKKVQPKVETKPKEAPKVVTPVVDSKPSPQAKPAEQPKPAQKPVGQPKPAQKPVEQPRPAQKPVEQPKPAQKPVQQPKPAQRPVEQPKPTQKPIEQPKPAQKPVEQPKPAQKPVEQPKSPQKPVEQPKPAQKPVEQPKPAQKPAEPKQQTTTPPPKPEPKKEQTSTPKPAATTPLPKSTDKAPPKPTPAEPKKQDPKQQKPVTVKPTEEKMIPITEEISSDTAKPPSGEPLRVIKKGGPVEIPAPRQ